MLAAEPPRATRSKAQPVPQSNHLGLSPIPTISGARILRNPANKRSLNDRPLFRTCSLNGQGIDRDPPPPYGSWIRAVEFSDVTRAGIFSLQPHAPTTPDGVHPVDMGPSMNEAERQQFRQIVETLRDRHHYSWPQISKAAGYKGKHSARNAYHREGRGEVQYLNNLRKKLRQLEEQKGRSPEETPSATVRQEQATPPVHTTQTQARANGGDPFLAGLESVRDSLWGAAQGLDQMLQSGVPPFVRDGLQQAQQDLYRVIEFLDG